MGQDGKCYGVDTTFCVCILTRAGRERRYNKKRLAVLRAFLFVGAEGIEPPTLCL